MSLIGIDKQKQKSMQRREILLEDGRYLIFYTFADEDKSPRSLERTAAQNPQPDEEEENQRV